MGRKKKVKIEEQPKEETTNNPNTNVNIGYAGVVTISIQDNKNSIIATKKFHNKGSTNLFEYFCKCIEGSYDKAKATQPNKIMLISRTSTEVEVGDVQNYFDDTNKPSQAPITFACSSAINNYGKIMSEKVADGSKNNLKPWKAIIHFRIPYAYITSLNICGIVLLPNNVQITDVSYLANDWYAYYLLLDEQGNWAELTLSNAQNYNLLIDWELSLTNLTNTQ